MIETLIVVITLSSGFLVVYHHALYPLILRYVRKTKSPETIIAEARSYAKRTGDTELPSITIVIPAYNEQQWISEKIRNLAALDYPPERLKVIIACDGCEDDTPELAERVAQEAECRHLNLNIRSFTQNRGKIAVINDVVQSVDTDLVALSDVSALISIDALLIAAAHFKDERVGVLNSHYQLLSPGSAGESTYWRYQSDIKASEAALGATLGAHGAFYLFRRKLFQPLAGDTINDDFILPMEIVAKGYRAKHADDMNALELEQAGQDQDHYRRRRIAAGNCQQLLRLKHLMLPRHGGVAFTFFSGKGLRVLMPFLMLIALIGSLILAVNSPLFAVLALLQVTLYALAAWQITFQQDQPPGNTNLGLSGQWTSRGHDWYVAIPVWSRKRPLATRHDLTWHS